ncbi:MAG: response regulator [Pseudomonadota bacterium]
MNGADLLSILYVEDNPQLRAMAKMALEVIGRFHVRGCSSGPTALLAASDFQPDLILLDVTTPRQVDGIATLAQLRGCPHLLETPAMFITGAISAGEMAQYIAAGAVGIIAKPLEPMRLAAQLRELWHSQRQRRESVRQTPFLPVLA